MRILLLTLLFLPLCASARNYAPVNLPYSDAPSDLSTAIAVSVLTDEGIVEGNPDGTFRPDALLNRAEFLKIAMGVLPEEDDEEYSLSCFPDVFSTSWYAQYVCRAKALGIVEGNQILGIPPHEWLFVPERNVQYVEALKILHIVMDVEPALVTGEWYEPYLQGAASFGIQLPEEPNPDYQLTRGGMSRLVTRFLAHSDGELSTLLLSEQGAISVPVTGTGGTTGSGFTNDWIDGGTGSGFVTTSGSVLDIPVTDPDPFDTDTSVRAGFLLLGEYSVPLGGAKIFSEDQPLDVTSFVIRIDPVSSINSFVVYNHDAILLGRAYRTMVNGGVFHEYRLPLNRGQLTIPKSQEYSFYVRADVKSSEEGGISGEIVKVRKLGVEGNGSWNNKNQSAFSGEDYPSFQTSRSSVTSIVNYSNEKSVLISGLQRRLGAFKFTGTKSEAEGTADLSVTDLSFNLNTTGGVNVSNVWLSADSTDSKVNCSVVGSTVTCSSISETIGSFEDRSRILTLYGDITIPVGASSALLQMQLVDPGSAITNGSVWWTDGTTNFHWISGDPPIVRSTIFKI